MNAQEKIDQLMKAEMEHIRSVGGILNLPEADSVLNDLNREKLKALKELHGHLYLGRINIHDEGGLLICRRLVSTVLMWACAPSGCSSS